MIVDHIVFTTLAFKHSLIRDRKLPKMALECVLKLIEPGEINALPLGK